MKTTAFSGGANGSEAKHETAILTTAQRATLKRADDLITNARTDIMGVYKELPMNDAWEALDGILDEMDEVAWRLVKLISDSKEGQ